MKCVSINQNVVLSNDLPFVLIAGPCALENRDMALRIADALVEITSKLHIPYVFKASFDKANRTSLNAKRGLCLSQSLKIFEEIKNTYKCPVITDVHESYQCDELVDVVDVFQIPAFLCRQTDLIVSAAKTKKPIMIKKGQFLAPWDMKNVYKKVIDSGNEDVILCERGACFGYNRLIVDMRSLKIMSEYGYPVVFDATHSVQEPGGLGDSSGGNREYVEVLARAAASIGIAGLFIETHFDPENSYSDGPNMVPLNCVEEFIANIKSIDELSKNMNYINLK